MIVLQNVHKTFPGEKQPLFENLNASLHEGSFTGLIGPSGSGKSTLLRIINRLEGIDRGNISFRGQNIREYPVQTLRRQIGFVFQQAIMLAGTVRDNLLLGPRLHKQSVTEEICVQALQDVDLDPGLLDHDASELSGGQQQRLSLLRTLLLKPKVLLLDEPTSALDEHSKRTVEQYVRRLNREQKLTVLWITHDLEQLKRIMDDYWFLANGQLVEQGSVEQLFTQPKQRLTREFVGQEGTH